MMSLLFRPESPKLAIYGTKFYRPEKSLFANVIYGGPCQITLDMEAVLASR